MKNMREKKVFVYGLFAAAMVIASAFTACLHPTDNFSGVSPDSLPDNYPGNPPVSFTSITDFQTWLSRQPDNTAAKAYIVKLNVNNLGGNSTTPGSVGEILKANSNSNKYVSLDLSGSTFTGIEDSAFDGCANLTGIILPSGVTSIGDQSFNRCTNLTSVNIPNGVTSIGGTAFNDCRSLTRITIPNSITSIGDGAFAFCRKLTSITIPNKVNSIGFGVYQKCDSLTSIIIPSSVTSIGEKAFNENDKLISVTFQGTIASGNFHNDAFNQLGDLRDKFYATNSTNGTPGTYTTTAPVSASSVWTKKS